MFGSRYFLPIALAGALIHAQGVATVERGPITTIDELIEKHTSALGGREKLEALESIWLRRGERTVIVRKRPHFIMVVVQGEAGGIRYAEGYDGTIAWEEIDDGGRKPVQGRPLAALRHTTRWPSSLNPLYRAGDDGTSLDLNGTETLDGTPYYKLIMTLDDGFQREYFINTKTFFIERSRDNRRHHAYEETVRRIETVWSDFRSVEGWVFPFREIETDGETGEVLSEGGPSEIRVNVAVKDADFGLKGGYGAVLAPLLGPHDAPGPKGPGP